MRRLIIAVAVAVSAAMPVSGQIPVTVGGFTFTDNSYGKPQFSREATRIEFIVRSFSYPLNAGLLNGLVFDWSFGDDGFFGTATFHGGARLVGAASPVPSYRFGEFDVFGTAYTPIGRIIADFFDPPLVGCDLTPSGAVNGVPYWHAAPGYDTFQYANVCGPDQYLDVVMDIPHALSVNGVDVTSTPEPATLALFATGFLAVAGIARRRRRLDAHTF